jgi:hypothetical protein
MTDYSTFLLTALESHGADPDRIEALLATLAKDADGQRMLACLAIDLHTGGIPIDPLLAAANACVTAGRLDRAQFAEEISAGARDAFSACIAASPVADGSAYATLMNYEKFIFFFRAHDATPSGDVARAKELEFFKAAPDRVPDTGPKRPLRGPNRPVNWITRLGDLEVLAQDASFNEKPLPTLVERLGLPWKPGAHDVLIVYYPPGFESRAPIGRPNSMCETWEKPGMFVAAASDDGWGRTCGRRDASHGGLPERVHGELPPSDDGYGLEVGYLGHVVLEPADNAVALRAAEERWAALSARSTR